MSLPEFNVPSNQAEWDRHMKGFRTRVMRCTRRKDVYNIPPNLNILWLSADFDESKQVDAGNGIRTFLEVSGYNIQDTQLTERNEADLLFISTDGGMEKAVSYLVSTISYGFLGLVPKHDMLVSGPGVPGGSPYKIPNGPLWVSTDFMVYGMCLIHEYIRTLHDPGALCGRHITMMLELEGKLLQTGIATSKHKNASNKSDALRSLLKKRGHADGEARWVFAVFNLLRHARNFFGHTPPLQKDEVCFEKAQHAIEDLATEYGRPLGVPRESNIQDSYSGTKRWTTQLTQITMRWIDEYVQAYPVQSGAAKT